MEYMDDENYAAAAAFILERAKAVFTSAERDGWVVLRDPYHDPEPPYYGFYLIRTDGAPKADAASVLAQALEESNEELELAGFCSVSFERQSATVMEVSHTFHVEPHDDATVQKWNDAALREAAKDMNANAKGAEGNA